MEVIGQTNRMGADANLLTNTVGAYANLSTVRMTERKANSSDDDMYPLCAMGQARKA